MKFRLPKFMLSVLIATTFLSAPVFAQDLTGIWRGYFLTDNSDQYKFEIQIEQSRKKGVTGVSYSYLDTRFYGKAALTGNFNTTSQMALVQEIKTVEVRMSGGSVACIMKCLMQYSKSGKEEFLEGTYTSKYEKSDKQFGIKQGEGCGGGKIFLRKVPTSDFYVEPFLRDNPATKKPDVAVDKPAAKNTPSNNKPPKTTTTKPVTGSTTPKTAPSKPPVKKPVGINKPKTDTIKRAAPPPVAKEEVKKPSAPSTITLPAITRSRQNELTQTVTVNNQEVTVRLYDNGEIDDDTISVYLDNQLVLASKRLSAAPILLTLKMNQDNPEHVLVMVAENLGRIPPNTSLMIVQDGDKRYQVRITSTNQKNAMVRFRYQGSD